MTEQLADISARIRGTRQLEAVVNAMKGIAAARAHFARTQVETVDNYASTISGALASAIARGRTGHQGAKASDPKKRGLLIFCAEQGFAGAFSERVLDSVADTTDPKTVFLIGTRGLAIARARGMTPKWASTMPSHSQGIPKLADETTNAIYRSVTDGMIDCLNVVYTRWNSGRPALARQQLFPLDLSDLPIAVGQQPMMQLPIDTLIDSLGRNYFHALLCKIALHAFAAENEVRMETMSAAGSQIEGELETLEATLRRTRQEAITAEIIELSTGASSRPNANVGV